MVETVVEEMVGAKAAVTGWRRRAVGQVGGRGVWGLVEEVLEVEMVGV